MLDLEKIGQLENTLIVVTADHGHGFVRSLSLFHFAYSLAFIRMCLEGRIRSISLPSTMIARSVLEVCHTPPVPFSG